MSGRKPRKRRSSAQKQSGPIIRWAAFPAMHDERGHAFKRAFQLETLASAVERRIRTSDRFITPSIQSVLGPGDLSSLSFELLHEDRRRLIFDFRAINTRSKRGRFALVVAKNPVAFSDMLEAEHRNLQLLSARAPDTMLRVYRGGKLFLPDRHRRADMGRELYAFVAQSPANSYPLGVGRNGQFLTSKPKRHTFTRKATEQLKGLIIEGVLGSYDSEKCECIAISDMNAEDIFVQTTRHGKLRIRIVSCPKILSRINPARIIKLILGTTWKSGDSSVSLAPAEPRQLFEQFAAVFGREMAAECFTSFLQGTKVQRRRGASGAYLEALAESVPRIGKR